MSNLVANLQHRHHKSENHSFPIEKNCVFYKFFNFLMFFGVKYTRNFLKKTMICKWPMYMIHFFNSQKNKQAKITIIEKLT